MTGRRKCDRVEVRSRPGMFHKGITQQTCHVGHKQSIGGLSTLCLSLISKLGDIHDKRRSL